MLGNLIAALERPEVALGLLPALDEALRARLLAVAGPDEDDRARMICSSVHGFVEAASDDEWMQLVGIMNRSDEPGLAALRAILHHALPKAPQE
ncbi:hypothetical protein [Consotaella salsifontis]|uniref:Uncharacterized protein n=1 Tax=Consotaella salsifontis TaxID=1365950 RepID=A0A1T4Q0C8_9HYPH|nr:hypothetical protein [Consotaella salsifontis]SJZ97223.1 hypothetical protein SAMN05428963_104279 [Consotaella salsifontis]